MLFFVFVTVLVIVCVLIIISYKSIIRQIEIVRHIKRLPGPPATSFLLGNVNSIIGDPEKLFKVGKEWGLKYYPIYQVSVPHEAVAIILNPFDCEKILSNVKHNTKGDFYDMLHGWLGEGLLTSNGLKWQRRRKILTSAFHFNILQQFIQIFHEQTNILVEQFHKECHKPSVAVNEFITDFTLNTIGETAMGTSFGSEKVTCEKNYRNAIHEFGKIFMYRFSRPWLRYNFLYFFDYKRHSEQKVIKILHNFTNNVIEKREKKFVLEEDQNSSYSKRKRLAMLDLLLAAKQDGVIDDIGIREEVDTFMFEGHDTTAVAICHALLLLACHPEIQQRVYHELQQVLPNSTKADYKTLQKLKYMDICIKEVLRYYPSVIMISRILGEDITTHSGHLLKAGSLTYLKIYDLHHSPHVYPDPEKFDPDRFLPENCQKRHPFAYIPFSAGSRNCIGQKFAMLEIKSVLCGVLSEFVLEAVDTPQTITPLADLVMRTKEDIKVKFIPRSKGNTVVC